MNPQTKVLLTAALLNLDPRINDKRIALFSILVEVSLFTLNRACSLEEISEEIDRIINQHNFLSDPDLIRASEDCVHQRTITHSVDNCFQLSESRRTSFERAYNDSTECKGLVEKNLKFEIELEAGEIVQPEVITEIIESVKRVLTSNVYENSINLARQNLSFEVLVESIEDSEPEKIIYETIDKIVPVEKTLLKSKLMGGVHNYFNKMPDELRRYLKLLNSNVLLNQILNLDPSITQKQLTWYSHRRMYLDTNVVIAYFFEAQKCHKIAKEVIDASKRIGVQLFISPVTLDELKNQVERAKRDYILVEKQKILRAVAVKGDDAILATFLSLVSKQPSIEWIGFISIYEDLENLLLNNDILVENEGMDEALANPIIGDIERAIASSKSPYASINTIRHDVINCSLILTLRNKYIPDERGQVLWLLTIDTSLKYAQKKMKSNRIMKIPYSIQVSNWGEIVLPAQSLLGLKFDDFIGYLAQARLGAISDPGIIQLDFCETLLDSTLNIDAVQGLEPEQLQQTLIKLQEDHEARSLISNAKTIKNPEEKQAAQLKFDAEVEKAIQLSDPNQIKFEEYDKKLALLTNKLDDKDKIIVDLESKLKKIGQSTWYKFFLFIRKFFKNRDTSI